VDRHQRRLSICAGDGYEVCAGAFSRARPGLLSLQGRYGGRQYDDDGNVYLLHSYFRLDADAEHNFGRYVTGFASAENLFNRSIEVGKTPQTTLGTPRLVRVGLRVSWGE
jgi:hypothetical protein